MSEVHVVIGIAVVATNLAAASWGGWAWWRESPQPGFWYLLRVAQAAVVIQVALGALLLVGGREAADGLHYVYGLLPLLVSFMAEGARTGAAERELEGLDFEALPPDRQRAVAVAIFRRETGIMALSAAVIFGLALRAAFVSPGL